MNGITDKHALRGYFLKKRKELSPVVKSMIDLDICCALINLPEYLNAERILVYSPIKNEIELVSLFEKIKEDGKSTLFPRVFGKEMRFACATYDNLVKGSFGIMEPPDDADYVSEFTDTDVCILPCLAVDKNGNRLGYGGGFYDRFLTNFPGIKIAAIYDDFIIDNVFYESFDIAADMIVTEKGIYRA